MRLGFGVLEVVMTWVWTDELAALIDAEEGVDESVISRWIERPIALRAAGGETATELARREGQEILELRQAHQRLSG